MDFYLLYYQNLLDLDVLEHIEDEGLFFAKFAEKMHPGEVTIITVPANPNLWSPHDSAFGHYRRYTDKTIKNIWIHLPFENRLLSYFNTRLYPLIWLKRIINRKINKFHKDKQTDFNVLPSLLNSA